MQITDYRSNCSCGKFARLWAAGVVSGVIGFAVGARYGGLATQFSDANATTSRVSRSDGPSLLSQAAPSQPAPSQPAPSQPAPSQPAPSQPAPSQPAGSANATGFASSDPPTSHAEQPALFPSDTAPPTGGEVHEYLRQMGFRLHETDRENGIVEWSHPEKQFTVTGRVVPGNEPLFERRMIHLTVNRTILDTERVTMHEGLVLAGVNNNWIPLLPELAHAPERPGISPSTQTSGQSHERQLVNGWKVDVAPLPEATRRRIYFELCREQDAGTEDTEAYTVIARRFGVDREALFQIAGEGAVKQWPLPALP